MVFTAAAIIIPVNSAAQLPNMKLPTLKGPGGQLKLPKVPPGKGVYVASRETQLIDATRVVDVLKQSIPPGNYWIVVKGVIANDMNSPLAIACGLHDGDFAPAADHYGLDYTSISIDKRQRAMILLTAAYQQKGVANRLLRVSCRSSKNTRAQARWFKLTALAVDAITPVPGADHIDRRGPIPLPRR